jgi:hypothetical protein
MGVKKPWTKADDDADLAAIGLLIEASERFQHSIGPFIIGYSSAELMLYRTLLRYAKITDAVGRAVFSGTRVGPMINFIKGIAENTNMEAERLRDLENIFEQFAAINYMRDLLVHQHIGSYSLSGTTVSTHARASRYVKGKSVLISYEMMQAMTADLSTIGLLLSFHLRAGALPSRPDNLRSPWLYKPVQPISTQDKSRAIPRKRRGQHSSSPR